MPSYLTPGVYVEETPAGARPIQAVSMSTTAFFGAAPNADAAPRTPTAVSSFSEYVRVFGKLGRAGGTLSNAIAGFFENRGSGCFVINLGSSAGSIGSDDMRLIDDIDGIGLVVAPGYTDAASYEALIGDCERRADRFAILDAPLDIEPIERLTRNRGDGDGLRPRTSERGYAAVYAPWIVTTDAATPDRVVQPPSGHVAGLYCRTDAARGVHKAPTNAPLVGALALTRAISSADQELLNPCGVNCIREFTDGIRVWGARTLADAQSEWRYVPVRRLSTLIAKSIEQGTRWAVFEPNDATLWKSIRRDVGAFLHSLWVGGALIAAKAEQAYFVKCDAETTTQADIDSGRVVFLVGFAPVYPAEFVILRFCQSADASTVEAA